jgi:hypothetical protein
VSKLAADNRRCTLTSNAHRMCIEYDVSLMHALTSTVDCYDVSQMVFALMCRLRERVQLLENNIGRLGEDVRWVLGA